MEKFSQPADENGHVLLPGFYQVLCLSLSILLKYGKNKLEVEYPS